MTARTPSLRVIIDATLRGELSEALARQLPLLGPEAVVIAMLASSKRFAELNGKASDRLPIATHATPSGMIPVYAEPSASKKRQRPGAKEGHPGTRRTTPERIDRRESHRLKHCPECDGPLQRCARSRTRLIEDIPEHIQPVVTEHTIHRDYCPRCRKDVEPIVPDAMPKAVLGHHVIALTSWFHYGLGLTMGSIVDILQHHLQTRLTAGGLVQAWHRLAEVLTSWYEEIAAQARQSAVLHADETGRRINGVTHWLWCFTSQTCCYYLIDRCRGSSALRKFFTESFEGVLVTDFCTAYESVCAEDRQYCLVHLLRELEKVDQRNDSTEW